VDVLSANVELNGHAVDLTVGNDVIAQIIAESPAKSGPQTDERCQEYNDKAFHQASVGLNDGNA
jgi:hypothetical protein